MSRKFNPPSITSKISKAIADARGKQTDRNKSDSDKSDRDTGDVGRDDLRPEAGSKPGVGSAAAGYNPRAGVAERMGHIEGATGTVGAQGSSAGGSGSGMAAATGDLSSFAGAQRTGAAARIAEVQAGVAGRFAAPSLTDGPRKVTPETAIAEAKASVANPLREKANTALSDSAADQTTPQGIASQGTGAVSHDVSTKDGRIAIMESLSKSFAGTSAVGAKDSPDGVAGTKAVDASKVHPTLQGMAKVYQSNADEADRQTADAPAPAAQPGNATTTTTTTPTTDGVTLTTSPAGTPIAQSPDGTKTAVMSDGKTVIWKDGDRTVREADGSTTTLHKDGSVTETLPTRPTTSIPDSEGGDDRFRYVSEELKASMAPRGVEGGGDIDFGDDIAFGAGAAGPIADTKGTLLGDAGRGGAVVEGPATSGSGGLSPINNPDTIRPMDDTQMGGGGHEDDPLEALNKPRPDLQGGLGASNDDDDDDSSSSDDDSDT
jgi:hypothetical protein